MHREFQGLSDFGFPLLAQTTSNVLHPVLPQAIRNTNQHRLCTIIPFVSTAAVADFLVAERQSCVQAL